VYLLDTTVIIDFANGYPPGQRIVWELFERTAELATCEIVSCEALSRGTAEERAAVRALLDALEYIAVDPEAARWAGDRRRERIEAGRGKVSVTDALIAGLAWRLGATVVTRNARDFEAFPVRVLTYG
jgi:predicted nucleic acid-binding protein